MITIKTSELRDFLKRSKYIKPSNTLPILSYIKLDGDTLIKTNLNAYCLHHIESNSPTPILLDEKLIVAYLNSTNATELEIDDSGKNIIITDGSSRISFHKEDVSHFPVFPSSEGEKVETFINTDVLKSIDIARSYVKTDMDEHPGSFVHLKNGNEIFASNGFVVYFKKFTSELPELLLYSDACNAICAYEHVNHYTVGNYDFFDVGVTTYGFIKTQTKPMAYEPMIKTIKKGDGFLMDKECLEKFCELTISSIPSLIPLASIKDNGQDKLLLEADDNNYNVSTRVEVEAKKKGVIDDFTFNPRVLLPALKAIPYDFIHITPMKKLMYAIHSEDEDYMGIMMGYEPQSL